LLASLAAINFGQIEHSEQLDYLLMEIKLIENSAVSFALDREVQSILFGLLADEKFLQQVADQANCQSIVFTEILFQPVPYSPSTPKGMPGELEQYHQSPAHLIINVPPSFMFAAKLFQPSRLCAIYQRITN
jgi:hypothetical protein